MIIVYQSLESTGSSDDTMGTPLSGNSFKHRVHNKIGMMYPGINSNAIQVNIPTHDSSINASHYRTEQIKFATSKGSKDLSSGYASNPDDLLLNNFLFGVIDTIKASTRQRTLTPGGICREPDVIVLGEVYGSSMLNKEINGYRVIHGINPTGDSRHRFTVLRRANMSPKDCDDIELFPFTDTNSAYKDESAICMMLRIRGWLAAFVHTPNNICNDENRATQYIKNNVIRIKGKVEELDLLVGDTNQSKSMLVETAMTEHLAESFALYNFAPVEVIYLINLVGAHSAKLQSIPLHNNSLAYDNYKHISFTTEEIAQIKEKLAELIQTESKKLAQAEIELNKVKLAEEKLAEIVNSTEVDLTQRELAKTELANIDLIRIRLAEEKELAAIDNRRVVVLNEKLQFKTWQSSVNTRNDGGKNIYEQDVVGFGYQVFQIKGTNSGYDKHFDIACSHQATIKIFNSQVVGNPNEDIRPVFIFHGLTDKFTSINNQAYAYSDHNGIIVEILHDKEEHAQAKRARETANLRFVMPQIYNTVVKQDALDALPEITNDVLRVLHNQPNAKAELPDVITKKINKRKCIKCGNILKPGDERLKTLQGSIHLQCPPSKQIIKYSPGRYNPY